MICREKIDVRGVLFDNVTLDEAADAVREAVTEHSQTAVFTPNAEIVQRCIESREYAAVVASAELVIPDGVGVIKAARILGTPLKEKVPGIELGERVFEMAAAKGWRVFLLGSKPASESTEAVADIAAAKMKEKYSALIIAGTHDGYFDKKGAENDAVVAEIQNSRADVLYVCFGYPAQENWVAANRVKLPDVSVFLALGGSLDGYAGIAKRAPRIFIKLGLEWLYRLIKEPSRLGRMMKLPKFIFGSLVSREK